jgi:hypothetical protein
VLRIGAATQRCNPSAQQRPWDITAAHGICRGSLSAGAASCHRFDLHVAVLRLPVVVLLEQYGTDQANDRRFIQKDANHIGAALHLLIEPHAAALPGSGATPG